jgi:hypothetical protein
MDQWDQIEAQTIYARRKWSAECLEIPLKASKQEARQQWLKSLEEADFLPDEISLPAWRIVSDAESATEARQRFPEWASQFDDALGREIEEFAQRFFTLESAERRKEFTRLFNASRDNPRQQKRISSLSPGLKLPAAAEHDLAINGNAEVATADVKELSQHLRSMFLATPPVRARLHQTFLRQHASELSRWADAAKALKDAQSPLIELVPEQWEELTGWEAEQRQAAAFQEGLEERVALAAIDTRREESHSRSEPDSFLYGLFFNRYSMFFGVWILIKLVGAMVSSSNNPPSNYRNLPMPRVSVEDYMKRFDNERQKKYEAQKWITMKDEDFQAANGEEKIRSMGLENKRREYWGWRTELDDFEKQLNEQIELRNKLQSDLDHQESLESIWKRSHQVRLDELKKSSSLSGSPGPEQSLLEGELNEFHQHKWKLEGEQEAVENKIGRLQINIAGMNMADPSDDPFGDDQFDDAP